MDRVSHNTQQLIENLRDAVAEARRTREETRRLLRSTASKSDEDGQQEDSQTDRAPKLRLHRVTRW
jgi:uncharacterized coiled-coil protein SlyX